MPGKYLIIDDATPEQEQDIIKRYLDARRQILKRPLTDKEVKTITAKVKKKIKEG